MVHTDGRQTVANSPAARHRPAHGGYPGEPICGATILDDLPECEVCDEARIGAKRVGLSPLDEPMAEDRIAEPLGGVR
jgi:hypothetical protein